MHARQTRARLQSFRGAQRPHRRGRGREGHRGSGLHAQRLPRALVRGAGQGLLRRGGSQRHHRYRQWLGRGHSARRHRRLSVRLW